MDIWQALLLGTTQGLTEFIPVSSSGHLVLAEEMLGLHVESLKAFDVVVHMGTLVAIFAFFWRDFWVFILGVWHMVVGGKKDWEKGDVAYEAGKVKWNEIYEHQKWLGYIFLASVPAGVVGILFEDKIDAIFRSSGMVALVMIVVGLYFFVAEWLLKKAQDSEVVVIKADDLGLGEQLSEEISGGRKFNWLKGLVVGFAQAMALIPGVSRSGSTISAAISFGIDREQAARFSFLLGAPAIFGAGLITGLKLMKTGLGEIGWEVLVAGFVSSAVVGYACVAFLMSFLKKDGLRIFGAYLIVLGVVVTAWQNLG